jgi:L-iditol 2-dehydrogenase
MGADTISINVPLIQGREITLTGTFRYANTYPLALQLIPTGVVQVDEIITPPL